jgi:hypothetical protein
MVDDGVPILAPGARPTAPLVDSSACQVGSSKRISAEYDAGNARVGPGGRHYYEELKQVLSSIIKGGAHPFALSDFFARAVQRGLPIDGNALFADEKVLAMEARFMALCIPTLKNLHGDCREWLSVKLKKPPEKIEGSAGWNSLLGGKAIGE